MRSSSIAWLASALRVAQLAAQASGASRDGGLEAQQDPGQRLVDLVVEILGEAPALLLLRAQDGAAGLAALLLDPAQHRVEARGQTADLLGGAARHGGAREARRGEVGRVHARDQRLDRREARRSSSELSRMAHEDAEQQRKHPATDAAPARRARVTVAATNAVRPTSVALTARTCVRSVRERIRSRYRQGVMDR